PSTASAVPLGRTLASSAASGSRDDACTAATRPAHKATTVATIRHHCSPLRPPVTISPLPARARLYVATLICKSAPPVLAFRFVQRVVSRLAPALLLVASAVAPGAAADKVTMRLQLDQPEAVRGGQTGLEVWADIERGWHINGHRPNEP